MIKNLLIFLITSSLFLLAANFFLPIFWENPYANSSSASYVELRQQRSNLNKVIDRTWLDKDSSRVNFRSDHQGFLFPSFQYEHPDTTVVFLGGSTTECSYVAEDLRFPALVSAILKQKQGFKVNTLNMGRSGNTTHDAINLLFNKISNLHPQFVVLMEATNDAGVLSVDKSYSSRMGGDLNFGDVSRWLGLSLSSQINLIALLREAYASFQLRFGGLNHYDSSSIASVASQALSDKEIAQYKERLLVFITMSRAFGIRPILMTQPLAEKINTLTPDWAHKTDQEKMNETIRVVSDSENVDLIDLAKYLQDEILEFKTNPERLLYDGMHVTDAGSQIYAEYIASKLESLIRR